MTKQLLYIDSAGQPTFYDSELKRIYVHMVRLYYPVGKIYGWLGNTVGISIKQSTIEYAISNKCDIVVTVEGNKKIWILSAIKWKEFAEKYNAFYTSKIGEKCYCCQWAYMEELKE